MLGSGWGAASLVKGLNPSVVEGEGAPYALTLVSPRPYFTPLLPSAVGGRVDAESCREPITALLQGKVWGILGCSLVAPVFPLFPPVSLPPSLRQGRYLEARCLAIDPQRSTVTCQPVVRLGCSPLPACFLQTHPTCASSPPLQLLQASPPASSPLELAFDVLVIAVGSSSARLDVPGVRQHAWFLRTLAHAQQLRSHLRWGGGLFGCTANTMHHRYARTRALAHPMSQ